MPLIKRIFSLLVVCIGMLSSLSSGSEPVPNSALRTTADLVGKKAGYATGGSMRDVLEQQQDGISYLPYIDTPSVVQALRTGKVDVGLLDDATAQLWLAQCPHELYLAFTYADDYLSFAINKGNPLKQKIDHIIRQLEKSGELKQFERKWLRPADPARKITRWTHKADYDGSAGTIRYATSPTEEPMVYLVHNELVGLDIEIINRVAYELNMKVEYIHMHFEGLIETLMSGKADLVGGCMSVTPERQEKVDFVHPYYNGAFSVVACREKAVTGAIPQYTHLNQLSGKVAGIWTGTIADTMTQKHVPGAKLQQYPKLSDLKLALTDHKIDFFMIEEPQGRILQARHKDVCFMSTTPVESWDYAFVFSKSNPGLCLAFSDEIRRLRENGTLEQLNRKWFSTDADAKTMPTFNSGSKGTLRIGTVPEIEPFTYVSSGQFVGLDLELAGLIAEKLGYTVEFVMVDFASFAETLATGKIDMVAACVTVTEERREQFNFAESHYTGGFVAMVRNLAATGAGTGQPTSAWGELCTSFDRTFVREQRWKLILKGLCITIIITLASAVVGTLLAFPVWLLRTARNRVLRSIGSAYVAIMQGTPILVILMILYYVVFAKVDINSILVATIGFGLNLAAYAGEMLRAGIDGVPKGQREAALALGFTRFQTFRKVVLPQALRRILPVYRGEIIGLLKTTSVVGYIAIQDLTKMSDIIRSRTYEAFFPLLATAVIYFLTAMALAAVLNYTERRLNPNNRRKQA